MMGYTSSLVTELGLLLGYVAMKRMTFGLMKLTETKSEEGIPQKREGMGDGLLEGIVGLIIFGFLVIWWLLLSL